jgi:hypothetical protein
MYSLDVYLERQHNTPFDSDRNISAQVGTAVLRGMHMIGAARIKELSFSVENEHVRLNAVGGGSTFVSDRKEISGNFEIEDVDIPIDDTFSISFRSCGYEITIDRVHISSWEDGRYVFGSRYISSRRL